MKKYLPSGSPQRDGHVFITAIYVTYFLPLKLHILQRTEDTGGSVSCRHNETGGTSMMCVTRQKVSRNRPAGSESTSKHGRETFAKEQAFKITVRNKQYNFVLCHLAIVAIHQAKQSSSLVANAETSQASQRLPRRGCSYSTTSSGNIPSKRSASSCVFLLYDTPPRQAKMLHAAPFASREPCRYHALNDPKKLTQCAIRSTSCGRWMVQTRRTLALRSTSAGRSRARREWNHRSRQSTCALVER